MSDACQIECALEAATRALDGPPTRRQISAALHCALLADCRNKAECLEKVSGMIEAPAEAELLVEATATE